MRASPLHAYTRRHAAYCSCFRPLISHRNPAPLFTMSFARVAGVFRMVGDASMAGDFDLRDWTITDTRAKTPCVWKVRRLNHPYTHTPTPHTTQLTHHTMPPHSLSSAPAVSAQEGGAPHGAHRVPAHADARTERSGRGPRYALSPHLPAPHECLRTPLLLTVNGHVNSPSFTRSNF